MRMKKINCKGKRVLIIPDQHFPYAHKDIIRFLKAVKKKYLDKNSIIINLGDEADNHSISFHDSDSELFSAGHELEQACAQLQGLEKVFPKMFICDSNHGSLAIRRFKKHGIPIKYLKSLNEVYGVGNGWSWHDDILLSTKLGDVYICHGKSAVYGKLCKEMGCHSIQGHFHGKFEITWHRSALGERFNMFSGCLIDQDELAFAYGKNHLPKPILGCSILSKEGYPRLIKMNLNSRGRWDGKLP